VGIVIGLEQPATARDLLALIEADEVERVALSSDAAAFLDESVE
jgi:hypothetical protein